MNIEMFKYKPIDYFFKQSRSYQVSAAGIASLCLLIIILMFSIPLRDELWKVTGFWTLSTLVISSPVAFVIWRFRDENQSKDINLKEFQKIAEWVSGMHFPDNYVEYAESHTSTESTKTIQEHESEPKSEITNHKEHKKTETTKKPVNTNSFDKRSGAESLQIAAIYNLLPFYRGDHGSSFEKPAVNLLKSAWAIMQQDLLQQLNELEQDKTQTLEIERIYQELRNRANSPLGQAITRVWMACDHNGDLLIHRHPEIFAGLCLSGMNFGLAGLEIDILREKLFIGRDEQEKSFDYSGIQLQAANFPENEKMGFNFSGSLLNRAKLSKANLSQANLSQANLWGVKLSGADLSRADLSGANLAVANLLLAHLSGADLSQADLSRVNLSLANLSLANLSGANLSRVSLWLTDFSKAFMSDNQITDYDSFISNDIELSSTFMIIPSDVSAELQQALLQKNAIVAIEDDSEPSLTTIHCKNKQTNEEITWEKIKTNIDLPQTQALNPDWEIEIIKETT